MKKSLALFLVIIMMTGMVLAGCGGNEAPTQEPKVTTEPTQNDNQASSETSEDDVPKGMKKVNGIVMDEKQYLKMYNGEPESLDTTRSSISSAWIAQTLLFEGLTRVEMVNGVEKIVPGMAKSWDVSEDGTEYTFHLRDAVWSDGVAVKAQDFEYAIKRVLDPKTASPYSWFLTPVFENGAAFNKGEASADEVGVVAVDEKTLKFKLSKPIPYFMQYTYFIVLAPLRQDIVEKYGDAYGQEADQIVSNGPFVVTAWQHDSKMTYVKNDKYWDKENVYLDDIEFVDIKEVDARMQGMLAGDLDVATVFKKEWNDKFEQMADNFYFLRNPFPQASWFVFNHEDKYLKNEKIRKAFFAGFDRAQLNEVVFGGFRLPADNFIPDSIMIGDENYQDKVGSPKYVKKLTDSISDPKALLIEGLKEIGEDPDPAKMKIRFMPLGNTDVARKVGEFMQQQYKMSLGVEVELDVFQHNICYDKFDKKDFQIFSTGWIGDYDDPSTFIDLWHSEGGYYKDKASYKNSKFDELVDKASASFDNNERADLYTEAEKILIFEDAACAPYEIYKRNTAVHTYLKNFHEFSFVKRNFVGTYTVGR